MISCIVITPPPAHGAPENPLAAEKADYKHPSQIELTSSNEEVYYNTGDDILFPEVVDSNGATGWRVPGNWL